MTKVAGEVGEMSERAGHKTFGDWWIKNGDKYSLEDADAAAEDVWKDRDAEIAALQERIRVLDAQLISRAVPEHSAPSAAMSEPSARDAMIASRDQIINQQNKERIVINEENQRNYNQAIAERDAFVAAAYKAAADYAHKEIGCGDPKCEIETHKAAWTRRRGILALTPEAAQLELGRQLAAARLDEAEWWYPRAVTYGLDWQDDHNKRRIADLEAALARLSQPASEGTHS